MPAPIAIFVFNRPLHTRQTLRYLSECTGIENTIVYIFADGKRNDETADGLKQIEEVSKIIGSVKIGKQTIICERGSNLGLAKNIIAGVGEVIEQHEQIIVLEDDMEVTKGFLSYMNDALELYKNESQVGCIHAWNYLMDTSANSDTTFFLKGADCWGWATWKRAWKFFNADGQALYYQIQSSRKEWDFDR
jgi:GT2 family glycosyltransferase